jgi:pimeloyl-ACP methyl ester carboxylesterase
MRSWTRRSVLAAGLSLAGCSAIDRPRLGSLYAAVGLGAERPPLIVIPGAFGSVLRDRRTGEELWPASDSRLLLDNYRSLELQIDPLSLEPRVGDVEASSIFRRGLGRDFYGQVLDTLVRVGGYRRCRSGPGADADCNLYEYVYDFRLDIPGAARGLAALIRHIREQRGDPSLRVDILAHSNGGMLARYYARHGERDLAWDAPLAPDFTGAPSIRRLLLVGTPNLGSLQPVLSLLRGEEIGLRRIPPEVVATCTGIAQMMPHARIPWLIDLAGQKISADIYDIETWREFGWSLFDEHIAERTVGMHGGGREGRLHLALLREYMARQLLRGRLFAESFATPPDPRDVRTWVLGGDCEPTLARLVVESVDGRLCPREKVSDIAAPVAGVDYATLMHEPGDAVVTRSSLMGRRTLDVSAPRGADESLRVSHSVFFCESHQQLMGNASLRDNLLNALLSADADDG